MRIYTSKNLKNYKNHFFKIFDVKAKITKLSIIIIILIYIYCFLNPVPNSYLQSLKQGYSLKGIDNLFDYTVPLIIALLICYVFFQDYKNQVYKLFQFYTSTKINYFILNKWIYYVIIFSLGTLLCSMMYYRNIAFLNIESLLLAIRFIPNILFLSSISLLGTVIFKNSYAGLFIMLTYYIIDFLSGARLFKYLSLGANSNNFYYTISPNYYLINRFLLLILSVLFILIASKKNLTFKLLKTKIK